MNDQNLLRGVFLMAIALLFGLGALSYQVGTLSRAGPGLFPLMVSCLLFLMGVFTVVRSRFVERDPLDLKFRNLAIILASLVGFVLLSKFLNMILAIVFLVFFSGLAGTSYSALRNLKISAGLLVIAFMLHKLLGLNLPLY